MFAIVKTGGKQYRVGVGDQITVERLVGDVGGAISLTEVLAIGGGEAPQVGTPTVAGASVTAKIVQQPRGTKVIVFKKKRRKNYRRKRGHRQELTVLQDRGNLRGRLASAIRSHFAFNRGRQRSLNQGDYPWRIRKDKDRRATAAIARDNVAASRFTRDKPCARAIS